MIRISRILELDEIEGYLVARGLLKQYLKAKGKILSGDLKSVLFKKRKPKTLHVYQFRINDKYRAYGSFDPKDEGIFRVFEINDHQD